jgi:hypothetical protein
MGGNMNRKAVEEATVTYLEAISRYLPEEIRKTTKTLS